MMENVIGMNIRKYRNKLKYTQSELAKQLNVERETVSNWELGKRNVNLDMICRISSVLGVKVGELIGESSSEDMEKQDNVIQTLELVEKKGTINYKNIFDEFIDIRNNGTGKERAEMDIISDLYIDSMREEKFDDAEFFAKELLVR